MEESIKHSDGIYAWLRWSNSSSAFLPVPREDSGKAERVIGMDNYLHLTLGMLGILSGGVESDESYDDAIRRELTEERGVYTTSKITNTLPRITVGQMRGGKQVSFDVHGHVIYIDQHLRLNLLQSTPVIEIPDDGLDRFLTDNRSVLRPFVYQVGMELVNSGRIHRL